MLLLHTLDLFGTVVFAASGALIAREQHRNGLIAVGYAVLTAVGGGTLRDLSLSQPIFWTKAPAYLLLAVTAGLLVFLVSTVARLHRQQLWLADAIGLATFTVIGTQVALQLPATSFSPLLWWLAPIMGLATGMGGGLVRDLLSRHTPYVLGCPIQAAASLAGGCTYSVLTIFRMPTCWTSGVAIAIVLLALPTINRALFQFLKQQPPFSLLG
ncbi:MAG: TRIC cation channel family protein [Cyanobacteria bacterium J06554_11]